MLPKNPFDAKQWVEMWLDTIKNNPNIPYDEGTMIGWFANAIMAGYDEAQRTMHDKRYEQVTESGEDALELLKEYF